MDFSKNLFIMPALEFAKEDLQELFEPFDAEKAGPQEPALPAFVKKPAELKPGNWAESLQLFSMY